MTTRIARLVIKNKNTRFIKIFLGVIGYGYVALDGGAACEFNSKRTPK